MRPRIVRLIAGRELREALRSRWFPLASACFLALSVGLAALGLAGSDRSGLAGFDRTTASVLNLALLFVPLLTLSVGGLSLAGALEDGALGMLLSQPVTRLEAYAGKFLGLFTSITGAVFVGFGLAGVAVGLIAGGGDAGAFLLLVAVTLALALTTLSVGMLLSALLQSRARVVGAGFVVWLALVYGSDLGTIGLTVARKLAPPQVFALAAFNPLQQARVLGTLALTDRPELLGPVGIYGQDLLGRAGLVAFLLCTLGGTALAALGVGYAAFRKAVVP